MQLTVMWKTTSKILMKPVQLTPKLFQSSEKPKVPSLRNCLCPNLSMQLACRGKAAARLRQPASSQKSIVVTWVQATACQQILF
eukprot:5404183-Karenia_brevis.AAC.1